MAPTTKNLKTKENGVSSPRFERPPVKHFREDQDRSSLKSEGETSRVGSAPRGSKPHAAKTSILRPARCRGRRALPKTGRSHLAACGRVTRWVSPLRTSSTTGCPSVRSLSASFAAERDPLRSKRPPPPRPALGRGAAPLVLRWQQCVRGSLSPSGFEETSRRPPSALPAESPTEEKHLTFGKLRGGSEIKGTTAS